MDYDLTSGHLSVQHGQCLITDIQWSIGHLEAQRGIEDLTPAPHMLHGIENLDDGFELYFVREDLRLHTDLTMWRETTTLGVIIDVDPGAKLSTGRSRIPIVAGDVYRLDPNKRHGAINPGFLAFLARDYRTGQEPAPDVFRMKAYAVLKRHLDHVRCPYRENAHV